MSITRSRLGGPPVVRLVLVIEMTDPSNERAVAFLLGPGDGLALGFERGQDAVGIVFDDKNVDRAVVGAALGASFYIDVGHRFLQGDHVSA
jgi:hypothetical protein